MLFRSRRQREQVAPDARIGEFMLNVLRLREGVDASLFAERTGLPFARIAGVLAALRERGLMQPDRLAATPLGWRYLDSLVGEFVGTD